MDDTHLISLKQACEHTSLSRTQINVLRREGRFPGAVKLSERRVAFVRAEVAQWVSDRIAARAKQAAEKAAQAREARP